jgi:iron uptake system EfeUOB component EfeO/EfeM
MSLVLPYLAAVDLSDDAIIAFLDEAVEVFKISRTLLRRHGYHADALTEAEINLVAEIMRQYRNKRGYTWWEYFPPLNLARLR